MRSNELEVVAVDSSFKGLRRGERREGAPEKKPGEDFSFVLLFFSIR